MRWLKTSKDRLAGALSRRAFAARAAMLGTVASAPSALLAKAANPAQGTPTMEKVTGIGGFFFVSKDPEAMRKWYLDHLGVDMAPQFSGGMPWQQDAGFTVFDPFPADNGMIPEGKSWMINFRVANLERMITQLRGAGINVSDLKEYPHGKFATLADPEGNGIQLWEVAAG